MGNNCTHPENKRSQKSSITTLRLPESGGSQGTHSSTEEFKTDGSLSLQNHWVEYLLRPDPFTRPTNETDKKGICSLTYLLVITPDLLQEVKQLLEFNQFVNNCQVYKTFSETRCTKSYTLMSENSRRQYNDTRGVLGLWRDAVSKNPLESTISLSTLLERVDALPTRHWNHEWQKARTDVLNSEKLFEKKQFKRDNRLFCHGIKTTAWKERQSSKLLEGYKTLGEVQQHFAWLSAIIFQSLLQGSSRKSLALTLSNYYKKQFKNDENQKNTATDYSLFYPSARKRTMRRRSARRKQETIHARDDSGNFIDLSAQVYSDILSYGEEIENEGVDVDDCILILDWASIGFEYHGIWFQLVRKPGNWKTYKREVNIARRLLFHPSYPCPPLLCIFSSFDCGFAATALLPDSFSSPRIPVQLSTEMCEESMKIINLSISHYHQCKDHTHNVQFSPILPNPGHLLSVFSPRLIPFSETIDLHAEHLISGAFMMCSGILPTNQTTNTEMIQFSKSVSLACHFLNRDHLNEGAILASGAKAYMDSWIYGGLSLNTHNNLVNRNPSTIKGLYNQIYAIAFNKNRHVPTLLKLSSQWDQADILDFAATTFGCHRHSVLPYDPMQEHGYYRESRDSPWKVELFGYRCSVWVPCLQTSLSGPLHMLRPPGIKRRKVKIFLNDVPWQSEQFVLIPAPSTLYLRPEIYLPHQQSIKTQYNAGLPSANRIIHYLQRCLPGIRSSSSLHRILHRFGLPVSVSLWDLWNICRTQNDERLEQLIACDLVAAAVKRVIRYHAWDRKGGTQQALKTEVLHCLLYSLLGIFPLGETPNPENVKIATDLLFLALWFALIKATQFLNFSISETSVKDVYDKAYTARAILRNCIMDRCRIQLFPDAEEVTHDISFSLSSRFLSSLSPQIIDPSVKMIDGVASPDSDSPQWSPRRMVQQNVFLLDPKSNIFSTAALPKIMMTFPSRDFLLRCLIALQIILEGDVSPANVVAHCVEFADCIPPDFLTVNLPTGFGGYSDFTQCTKQICYFCLAYPQRHRFTFYTHPMLRLCLLTLTQQILWSFQDYTMAEPLNKNIEQCLDAVTDYSQKLTLRTPADLMVAALFLKGLHELYNRVNLTDAITCFENTLTILISIWGDPKSPGGRGTASMLYICWILGGYYRLMKRFHDALWFEETFRATRLYIACCPLPLCFPVITESLNHSYSLSSGTPDEESLTAVLNWHHKHILTIDTLNWIAATNSLNDGTLFLASAFPNRLIVSPQALVKKKNIIESDALHISTIPLNKQVYKHNVAHSSISTQVYAIGSNEFGCLGQGPPTTTLDHTMLRGSDILWTSEKTTIVSLKDIESSQVSTGSRHSIILTTLGIIYSWGSDDEGQIGLNRNGLLEDTMFQCIGDETCEVTQFSWINLKQCGIDNHSHLSQINMDSHHIISLPMRLRTHVQMKQISCGKSFSSSLSINGSLYTWGSNQFGQLGQGDYIQRNSPTLVPDLSEIDSISCGAYYIGIISNGCLWTWGRGLEGQLGLSLHAINIYSNLSEQRDSVQKSEQELINCKETTLKPPKLISTDNVSFNGFNLASKEAIGCLSKPHRIRLFQWVDDMECEFTKSRLTQMGLQNHQDHLIWRFDPSANQFVVSVPPAFMSQNEKYNEEVEFLSITCGHHHTLAIDITNTVWSWGTGTNGELGLKDTCHNNLNLATWNILGYKNEIICEPQPLTRYTPCRISPSSFNNERLSVVQAGKDTSAAIGHNGKLWTWGSNKFGALGTQDINIQASFYPIQATLFQDIFIKQICFNWNGTQHAVVTTTGTLIRWGQQGGALGTDNVPPHQWIPPPSPLAETNLPILPSIPSNKDTSPKQTIIQVALGWDHCIVIASNTLVEVIN